MKFIGCTLWFEYEMCLHSLMWENIPSPPGEVLETLSGRIYLGHIGHQGHASAPSSQSLLPAHHDMNSILPNGSSAIKPCRHSWYQTTGLNSEKQWATESFLFFPGDGLCYTHHPVSVKRKLTNTESHCKPLKVMAAARGKVLPT